MQLIFLYGPPGVGKLTIATELSTLTGYKLLHNHLTADLVSSLFATGTREYSDAVWKIRLQLFETACRKRVPGIIFTFCYGVETFGGRDTQFVRDVVRTVRRAGGQIHFIKLTAPTRELVKRVQLPSRAKHGKLRDPALLKKILAALPMTESIPGVESVVIDTTRVSARAASARIVQLLKDGGLRFGK